MMIVSMALIFFYARTEAVMKEVQKIFYFHVSSAWISFLAFFILFIASILYLVKRDRKWDRLALSSGELGILFTTVTLITGSIWARFAWGTWWTWDPRLTTTLILWFIYVAYFVLRDSFSESERGARFCAIYGILGFVDVPIVFMAIRWWPRTIHPKVISDEGVTLDPTMIQTLIVTFFTFTLLFFFLLSYRVSLENLENKIKQIKFNWRKTI
jgi:heme exporter protein C